jgi:hypothetical protein
VNLSRAAGARNPGPKIASGAHHRVDGAVFAAVLAAAFLHAARNAVVKVALDPRRA